MGEKLLICLDEADIPESKSAISIFEIIRDCDEQNMNHLYNQLTSIDADHRYKIPVYSIVADQIWTDSGGLHEHSPRSMELLIPLYQRLAEQVNEETEVIKCVGVSGRYLDLVRDLAENKGLQLVVQDSVAETITDQSITLNAIAWLIISAFDAVLSLFLRPFFSSTDAEILVKYPVFRPETFKPIEERLDVSFDATFTLLTISYFTRVRSIIGEETPVVPLRCFDSIHGMFSNYQTLMTLSYDLVLTKRTESTIIDAVEKETGVRMETTVGRLFRRAAISNIKVFLYSATAQRLFENESYQSLLSTSTGPTAKALALPAEQHGIKTYVLHHSIMTPREPYDESFRQTRFTEGKIAKKELRRSGNKEINTVPTGLPKHIGIAKLRRTNQTDNGTNTVLLGTQPFPDGYRQEFVYELIPSILNQTDWDVLIKIHPGETIEFYRQTLRSIGIEPTENDRIQIDDGDLYTHIQNSDLLVTVNSNVGIESVILGIPAVVYNIWSPNFRDPLYTRYGTVPRCDDATKLIELMTERGPDCLFADQRRMIDGPYMVENNSIARIAERIQQEMMT